MTRIEKFQSMGIDDLAVFCNDNLTCPPSNEQFLPDCEHMPDRCSDCWAKWLSEEVPES